MKVLIAGGGTGGHIYPGIAVAEELKRIDPATEIRFVGGDRGLEGRVVPEAGFELVTIGARGLPRRAPWKVPGALLANAGAFFSSIGIVNSWKPDVVLGTGGYVSAPVVVAAWLAHRPVVLQEQNSVPGLTNRLLARVADEVHLAFSESRGWFIRKDRLKLSGNPVRRQILSGERRPALARFGLTEGVPTVFVFGGSRGARRINEASLDAMARLKGQLPAQYILQTGKEDFAWAKERADQLSVPVTVVPYLTHIHEAYAAADLVVCRAGAMTLAEIAACGVPSILVPYPYAAYNHQEINAQNLAERGGAISIRDSDLTGERLSLELLRLLKDKETLVRMSVNARKFARPDAAQRIARSLLDWAADPAGKRAAREGLPARDALDDDEA
ncbi:MAG: undecaprenyldiphospho-muramoylpentapeptide beta-N-acetylglucosaminyltransferase [Candidatus Eisenbacteria bacterium]